MATVLSLPLTGHFQVKEHLWKRNLMSFYRSVNKHSSTQSTQCKGAGAHLCSTLHMGPPAQLHGGAWHLHHPDSRVAVLLPKHGDGACEEQWLSDAP